uniref:LAGLIDADG endonuclease n=1 Tax=Peronospora matthiolae TaxID=2874970 RepID=A0AAV1VF42_9STRA
MCGIDGSASEFVRSLVVMLNNFKESGMIVLNAKQSGIVVATKKKRIVIHLPPPLSSTSKRINSTMVNVSYSDVIATVYTSTWYSGGGIQSRKTHGITKCHCGRIVRTPLTFWIASIRSVDPYRYPLVGVGVERFASADALVRGSVDAEA